MDRNKLSKLINLKAPLLITGDTGTGKSFLARSIYDQALVHKEKFLTVHLASLKEDLIESELFGHKKGSFTGAIDCKMGYFREVGEGTLFLDEIGELSLEAQKKLLYLLEERKFTPVGTTAPILFRGRIIMATNKNLENLVAAGLFREDLYFRIKVFHLHLSPVNENKVFLQNVIESTMKELRERYHSPYSVLSDEVMEFLIKNEWKGNLRELKNSLEYAVVMSNRNQIKISDFPEHSIVKTQVKKASELDEFIKNLPENYHDSLELFEKKYFQAMLERNGGKINVTAKKLGVSKTTLIQKSKKYQINTMRLRADALVIAA